MVRTLLRRFFAWYERYYLLNITVAAGLFVLQLAHLYWLTAHVVAERLFGHSYADLEGIFRYLILIVDYTEIPALISVSLVYVNELRKRFHWESVLSLLFLNSQWLHIFWITDEFVVAEFTGAGHGTSLPLWLAWVAILIDYLELPVIVSTIGRFVAALRERRAIHFLREELAD